MKLKPTRWSIIWAYLKEILLAIVLCALLFLVVGIANISWFIGESAGEWNKLTLALFSASLALWSWYSNVASSDFGGYLKHHNQHQMYAWGIAWSLSSFLTATILLNCCKVIDNQYFRASSFMILIYCGINIVSLVRNALSLFNLHGEYRRQVQLMEKEESST